MLAQIFTQLHGLVTWSSTAIYDVKPSEGVQVVCDSLEQDACRETAGLALHYNSRLRKQLWLL